MKNKETIDEALERLYPFEVGYGVYDRNSQIDTERERFIEGVKWREERSFTLDQIDELFLNEKGGYFDEFLDYRLGLNGNKRSKISFKEWFEKYKNKQPSEEVKHFHKKDQPSKEILYPSIIEVSGIDFEEHIKWEDRPNDPLVKKRVCIGKIEDKYVCIKSKESELENIMLKLGKNSLSWLTCGSVSGLVLEFWAHGRNIIKERTFNQWVKQYNIKFQYDKNKQYEPSSEIKGWCTDNVLTYVVIRTSEQELYVKENELDLIVNGIMGDVYVMVTKSEHPYLF